MNDMSRVKIIERLKILKNQLQKEGFIIEGLFGSYARGEETPQSDIDLLYRLEKSFIEKYHGFFAIERIEQIKQILTQELGHKVDLAASNALSRTGKKYILEELLDV